MSNRTLWLAIGGVSFIGLLCGGVAYGCWLLFQEVVLGLAENGRF